MGSFRHRRSVVFVARFKGAMSGHGALYSAENEDQAYLRFAAGVPTEPLDVHSEPPLQFPSVVVSVDPAEPVSL